MWTTLLKAFNMDPEAAILNLAINKKKILTAGALRIGTGKEDLGPKRKHRPNCQITHHWAPAKDYLVPGSQAGNKHHRKMAASLL